MSRYIFLIIFSLTTSCKDRDVKYSYFSNGVVKTKSEYLNGRKDGVLLEHFENGSLKFKQAWKNGLLDGSYEQFYPDGKLYKKGLLKMDKFQELTSYFRSGKLEAKYFYNSAGEIIEVEKFYENGMRDSIAIPFMVFIPHGDTLKRNEPVTLKARVINITDSIYYNGKMIISSSLDSINREKMIRVKDTLDLLSPSDDFSYIYQFTPTSVGKSFVHGQFIFTEDTPDEIIIKTIVFSFPYYVKDN